MRDLQEFLATYKHDTEEIADWRSVGIKLRIRAYMRAVMPPAAYISSVRCVVRRGHDEILAVRDPRRWHIIPGGRREAGETLMQTLRRELLEETGWTVRNVQQIAFTHLYHLTPKPENYPYTYPHNMHIIYTAVADSHHPDQIETDGLEIDRGFKTLDELVRLDLPPTERLFLQAALEVAHAADETIT